MNSKLKNIGVLSILIIILITLIFFFSQKLSSDYFIDIVEIFLTVLIICSISLGLVVKRKMLKLNREYIKKLIVFLLVFGTSFFSLYLYYINEVSESKFLEVDKILSIAVGLFSIILLIKTKYDLDNNVA